MTQTPLFIQGIIRTNEQTKYQRHANNSIYPVHTYLHSTFCWWWWLFRNNKTAGTDPYNNAQMAINRILITTHPINTLLNIPMRYYITLFAI